ncbi:MAG TPA: ATP-binding protein [Aggregatilineales bacterium]|nr:ATP-binding protein [Aggregatilineales bacterium]
MDHDPREQPENPTANELSEAELAHKQALKYGEDLRRVYLAEKAKRQELQLANQLLNAVFASTPHGLAALDENLIIQQANPVFLRLLEMPAEAVIGRPLADIKPLRDVLEVLHNAAPSELQNAQFELDIETPVKRSLLVNIAELTAGQLKGWSLTLQDQTERKRLEYQKIEFVNIAAHELRTPLATLIGLSELVLESIEDDFDPELRECLTGIHSSGYRLAHIVDELLAFAQITQGSLHDADSGAFNLAVLLGDIVDELEPQAQQKQVSMHFDPASAQVEMTCNRVLLRAALYQLLLNAINFNKPGGSVWVRVSVQGDTVQIEIEDNGLGIPQAEIDAIFQPFFQVEEHSIRHVGGLGLGLPIVNHAIAQLGGKMTVESALNEGTTFRLSLPVHQPEASGLTPQMRARLASTHQQSLIYARDVRRLYQQLEEHFLETLTMIIAALEARDDFHMGHSERVTALARAIGREMGLPEQELQSLEIAARIHDIGKIAMPDRALYEAYEQPEHRDAIMQHIEAGRRILTPLRFLADVLPIALAHHERYDGQGLPDGLAGEAIPLGARIIAVANDYDIMTSPRPHRPALSPDEAREVIRAGAGTKWDPHVVEAFLRVVEE